MNELIMEVEQIIATQKLDIERNKKHVEFPYTSDCDHYYRLVILINTLSIWERCLNLLARYKVNRADNTDSFRSTEFEQIISKQKKGYPGHITIKAQMDMIQYMKKLEWRIDELERLLKHRNSTS